MSTTELTLHLRRTVKGSVPSIPYLNIARSILRPHYELSLTVCGDTLARKMNSVYRKKTYSPNVLSFPYGNREGEIFLNVRKAAREARAYGVPLRDRLALLFVHGCYHLAGHDHGEKMEALERKVMRTFGYSPN